VEIVEENIQTFREARFLVQAVSKAVQMETDKLTGMKYESLKITVLVYVTRTEWKVRAFRRNRLSLSLSLSLRTWKQEALTKNLKSHKILLRLAKERDNFWLTEISFATPLAQILCFFEDTHSAWHVVYKLRNLTLEYCRHLISCARNRVDGCELDPCRMMDSSERANGIVSTQYVRRNKFGIPATCFAQSGPALEETRTI